MNGLIVVGAGFVGAFVGWWAGIAACPDLGDIGLGAVPWAVGGAAIGAGVAVFAAVELVAA